MYFHKVMIILVDHLPTLQFLTDSKKEMKAAIRICRHSIVGTSSIILPGVTLSEGTAIGAMSMVTKSTEPWSIYFGIPAKKIKDRRRDLLELEKEYVS